MAFKKNQGTTEATEEAEIAAVAAVDSKKYGRLLRMYRDGFLSVCIYKNVYRSNGSSDKIFFDIVIYRKIRTPTGLEYRRGANLKPADLEPLASLLAAAREFLETQVGNAEGIR